MSKINSIRCYQLNFCLLNASRRSVSVTSYVQETVYNNNGYKVHSFFQVWCLYVARLLQGAAVGIAWVVAPAYVGEMASVQIRGILGLIIQLSYTAGLLFSYTSGWLLNDYVALTIVSGCVAMVSGMLFFFLPESPHYLMLDGRADDAAKCLWSLRSYTEDELQTELLIIKNSVFNNRYIKNYNIMCRIIIILLSLKTFLFTVGIIHKCIQNYHTKLVA